MELTITLYFAMGNLIKSLSVWDEKDCSSLEIIAQDCIIHLRVLY